MEGRNCRGGFGTSELDDFIPGWRDKVSEIGRLKAEVANLHIALEAALAQPRAPINPQWECPADWIKAIKQLISEEDSYQIKFALQTDLDEALDELQPKLAPTSDIEILGLMRHHMLGCSQRKVLAFAHDLLTAQAITGIPVSQNLGGKARTISDAQIAVIEKIIDELKNDQDDFEHPVSTERKEGWHAALDQALELIIEAAQGDAPGDDGRLIELGKAVERAAKELPIGVELHIELERDAGTVRLYLPPQGDDDAGDVLDDWDDGAFQDYINQAIDTAITASTKGQSSPVPWGSCQVGNFGDSHDAQLKRRLDGVPLPDFMGRSQMILCPVCGNKRCPHANDPTNYACTGSNEPGQPGSAYPLDAASTKEKA